MGVPFIGITYNQRNTHHDSTAANCDGLTF
jgi:hypothetical protein